MRLNLFLLILLLIPLITALPQDADNSIDFTYPEFVNYSIQNVSHADTADVADITYCWSTAEGVKCDVVDILTSELNNDAGFITNAQETDSLSLHLNQDNWFNDSLGYTFWDGDSLETNLTTFDKRYLAGSKVYFLWNYSSPTAGYNIMNETLSERAKQTQTFTGLTGTSVIAKWINTNTNVTFIQGGLGEVHFHAEVTNYLGAKDIQFYVNITKRLYDDTEIPLSISETAEILSEGENEIYLHTIFPETILNITDRLEFELYAVVTGSGNDPDVNIYTEEMTASHFSFPNNEVTVIPDLSGYLTSTQGNNTYVQKEDINTTQMISGDNPSIKESWLTSFVNALGFTKYQFGSNNFNGSGEFNTTAKITVGEADISYTNIDENEITSALYGGISFGGQYIDNIDAITLLDGYSRWESEGDLTTYGGVYSALSLFGFDGSSNGAVFFDIGQIASNGNGDFYVSGSFTNDGGSDPPYVLYFNESRQQVVELMRRNIPLSRASGMSQFYNEELNRFEFIKPLTCEIFVNSIDGKGNEYLKLITTYNDGNGICYNPNSEDKYIWDNIKGEVKTIQQPIANNIKIPEDKILNRTTGILEDKINVIGELER